MREGRIEQDAAPAELFTRPATPFVARFMGYENIFPVQQGALKAGLEADGLTLQMHGVADSVTHLAWRPSSVPVVAPMPARCAAWCWRAAIWARQWNTWSAPRWALSKAWPHRKRPGLKVTPWACNSTRRARRPSAKHRHDNKRHLARWAAAWALATPLQWPNSTFTPTPKRRRKCSRPWLRCRRQGCGCSASKSAGRCRWATRKFMRCAN